jgi:hypothetical protein
MEECEDDMIGNGTTLVTSGARVLLLLLILTLSWAATAQAQEGPADNEYGNPADIPEAAATGGGSGSGGGSDSGGAGVLAAADTGSDSDSGATGVLAAGNAPASGIAGILPTLPLTGGASLLVLSAGVLLAGGGLVVRRMLR